MTFHDELNEIRKRAGLPLKEEAQPYDGSSKVLFHGTNIWSLALIITTNSLEEGSHWGKPDEPYGPRFSENFDIAYEFIEYASPEWAIGGVLILDTKKLMQNYKMVSYVDTPYDYAEPWGEEQEVVPITKAIKPLSKFLRGIKVEGNHIREGMSDEGIEYAIKERGYKVDPDALRQAVANLARHPLRG